MIDYINRLSLLRSFGFILTFFCLMGCAYIAQAVTLNDVSYSFLQDGNMQLKISLSEPIQEEPLSFAIDNPTRIALDFPNTILGSVQRIQPINVGVINSISLIEGQDRTRVVVNLAESINYHVDTQENIVLVLIGDSDVGAGGLTHADDVSSAIVSNTKDENITSADGGSSLDSIQKTASLGSAIENIDFRRGEDGAGRVIITLSDPSINVDMQRSGSIVDLKFIDTELPNKLDRKLNVVDFATPVKEIDTKSRGDHIEMAIAMLDKGYDHLAYQLGNKFIVEVRELTQQEQENIAKKGFQGERLSLNFQDIEVRAILQLIADFTGFNMVASDTVTGSETLRLKNVPWDQALDIILKAKGLGLREVGNVIMIAPSGEIIARERQELEAARSVAELAPLQTEFIRVNYAKAADIESLIKQESNSLLSERGSVTIDERTNTLIVQDVANSIESVRELLSKLDIPVRQVLIESRIVTANENFAKDLGVRFGYSKNTKQGNALSRADIGEGNAKPFVIFAGGNEGNLEGSAGTGVSSDDGAESLLVDLAAPTGAGAASLVIGKIGSYLLQLELSALIAEGHGEEIAAPKVITANQRQARIESGVELPFQEASSSGATTTAFKQAVLSLDVTPQITPDDRVILDLNVTQDTPGAPVIGGIPISTNRVMTQVLVDDGETVVLGGVYTRSESEAIDRIPFFADLPYVGFLFKRSNNTERKQELLIFVTPKILQDNTTI